MLSRFAPSPSRVSSLLSLHVQCLSLHHVPIQNIYLGFLILRGGLSDSNKVSPQCKLLVGCLPLRMIDSLHPYRMGAPTYWSCVNETMVSTCCGHNALLSSAPVSWGHLLVSSQLALNNQTHVSEPAIVGGDEQDFYYPSLLCGWGFVMTTVDPDTHAAILVTHWCVGPEQWWWCEVTSRGGWEMSWEGWENVTRMWENVTNIRSSVPGNQVKHERLEFVTILKYELLWQKESRRRELVYPDCAWSWSAMHLYPAVS